MCIVCVEYNKGNLTPAEFFRNLKEFPAVPHDNQAYVDAQFQQLSDDLESLNKSFDSPNKL